MSSEKHKTNFGRVRQSVKNMLLRLQGRVKIFFSCDAVALRRLVIAAIAMWAFVLIWVLWLKCNDNQSIILGHRWLREMSVWDRFLYDLVPFNIRFDFQNQFFEILANGIVFAPYGIAFSLAFKKKNLWRDIGICFAFSLSIEVLQLFTTIGGFATVDLIMNTAGYFVGYAAYKWVVSKFSVKTTACILWVANAFLVAVLIFATVRTAQSIDVIIGILMRTME